MYFGETINSIDLAQNVSLLRKSINDKTGIIDVRAKINNKDMVDIEMQIADNHNIEERILFYWARMYEKQIAKSQDYSLLNRCISVIFLNYEPENLRDLPLHTIWQLRENENSKILLTKKLEIHIILLGKEATTDDNRLKKWLTFFKNPYGEEVKKMADVDNEIKEALEGLYDINADEQKVMLAELRLKHILDKKAELRTAENKGLKRGIEEGIEQEKLNVAKKLKEKNVDIEIIIEITGLTKEQIDKL